MKRSLLSRLSTWIIVIEYIIIFCLVAGIFNKATRILTDRRFVATLHKEQYVLGESTTFPHFYEPTANVILNDQPDWLGYNVSYSINDDSLNERMEYPMVKPAGKFRMVMLGDSFTFGLFVNTFENYTEVLENSLNKTDCPPYTGFEVINLGVSAYDVGFSAERFRLRGQKYTPDLVVWFFNPFTFEINADRKTELENKYLQDVSMDKTWRIGPDNTVSFYPAKMAWNQSMSETPREDRVALQATYFGGFLDMYHGPLVIVANEWRVWSKFVQSKLIQAVIQRPHTWVYTAMPDLARLDGLHQDKHPNVKGHEIIASNIFSYLHEQNVVRCER